MKSPVVRLKLRVRLPDGSRPYLDPVRSANNQLKPGFAMHDGKPVHFPDGVYHLRYLKGSRRVWEGVGTDAQFALVSKLKREKSLDAKAVGVNVIEDEPQATMETDLRRWSPNTSKRSRSIRARRRSRRIPSRSNYLLALWRM